MTKHSPENERIKRKYFAYLKEAKRHSEATLDATAKALNRFEENTRYRSFKAFHYEQAIAFKRHLGEQEERQEVWRETEQGDLARHTDAIEAILPVAGLAARIQSPAPVFPMRTTSICPKKTPALPRRTGNRKRRHWSR